MLDLSSIHYQLSNAPSLVPVLKAVLHNFTKQLNEVWWYSLDPVVTSLQPQLSPNPDEKKIFWGQIWVLLTIGFPTRHRLSLYEQQNSQCLKTVFCGVYALPTSPRWRHSPSDFRVIHMQKKIFWGQIWNVLISSFRTRHRSSPYEEYPLGSHKTLFTWGPPSKF